jgi:hypothetical protein
MINMVRLLLKNGIGMAYMKELYGTINKNKNKNKTK